MQAPAEVAEPVTGTSAAADTIEAGTHTPASGRNTIPLGNKLPLGQKDFAARIKQAYQKDPTFCSEETNSSMLYLEGLWWKGKQIASPADDMLRQHIISEAHDSEYAGHMGYTKTLHTVQRNFTWPHMAEHIHEYVHGCHACQTNKKPSTKPAGLLQPIAVPDEPWDVATTDFITGLPTTQHGYDAILVFVDKLTKYVHLAPTYTTCTAEDWAELFRAHVVVYHGLPKRILSDRGGHLVGHFNQALAKRLDIAWDLPTAYKL